MTAVLDHFHWLTLVFLAMESIFFIIQVWDIYNHPHERRQWWYLILLALLLVFNLANGLFPDAALTVPVKLQYILADGSAYLLGAYFPLYFYKAFELDSLRFHALKGVPVFLFVPYLAFLVGYLFNNRLLADREYSVLVPAAYGLFLLSRIFRTIQRKGAENPAWPHYREALAVWAAILPWEAMSGFAFFTLVPQWLKILSANLGWLVVTLFMMARARRDHHARHRHYQELFQEALLRLGGKQEHFRAICRKYGYTQRQSEIVLLLCEGLSYRAIGEKLHLAPGSVDNRIQEIYQKTGVHGRVELIRKLGL